MTAAEKRVVDAARRLVATLSVPNGGSLVAYEEFAAAQRELNEVVAALDAPKPQRKPRGAKAR